MEKRESLWEAYLRRGFSRRSFLKGCVALTSLMGFGTDMFSKVVEAAETKPLPVVIWIHGHECTGCDESFIRSGAPLASDVVLSSIALEYDHLLSAACGAPFEAHLDETIAKYNGQYILAVEGAVATRDSGVYCMSGGHTFTHLLAKAAKVRRQSSLTVRAWLTAAFKLPNLIRQARRALNISLAANLSSKFPAVHRFPKL